MRTLKTDLKLEDLQKPALDVAAAEQVGGGNGTASGALLLPENKEIAKALDKAPVVEADNDWMNKGNPLAPELAKLEAKARAAREAAEMQAQAAAVMPQPQPMAMPLEAVGPPAGTNRFPWTPSNDGAANEAAPADEIDEFAQDMGVPLDTPTSSPAETPITASPSVPPAEAGDGEVVLHIKHDPEEFMRRVAASAKRLATTDKPTANGAMVTIDHSSTMDALPYTPPVKHHDHRKAA